MRKYFRWLAGVVGLWLIAGMAGLADERPQANDPKPQAPPAAKAPDQDSAKDPGKNKGGVVDPKAYVIGPEDVLRISVWREPELSGVMAVRPDGKISLQLVGELQASGLTPEQLSASITEGLSKYMTRPEVSVSVQAANSKRFFISGEVFRTGIYPLLAPTTVLSALVNAGGFRDFANTKKIIILRGTKRFYFNYKEVLKGKHMEQNILLENGDQIIVP